MSVDPRLTTEADLLEQINRGLPIEREERYYELIEKRLAETLTSVEHQELMHLMPVNSVAPKYQVDNREVSFARNHCDANENGDGLQAILWLRLVQQKLHPLHYETCQSARKEAQRKKMSEQSA